MIDLGIRTTCLQFTLQSVIAFGFGFGFGLIALGVLVTLGVVR